MSMEVSGECGVLIQRESFDFDDFLSLDSLMECVQGREHPTSIPLTNPFKISRDSSAMATSHVTSLLCPRRLMNTSSSIP